MSAYALDVRDDESAEEVVVVLSGELDLTNAREVEERLTASMRTGCRLVLDLNRVSFIDSAALHVLFRLSRSIGPAGLTIAVEPDAPVARTLDIVGVPDLITVTSAVPKPGADPA